MTTAGKTTQDAPTDHGNGDASFEIYVSFDIFVATGAAPDASGGLRI